MLKGDGNENGIKINRSNQQKKKNLHMQHTFFLISKNTNFQLQHVFCLFLPLFCTTTMPFVRLKRQASQLFTHYFYGGVVVCAYQRFCFLCSYPLLLFHCCSFSPEWFSSNEIRLPSSFSVINVIVNIKNNVEKDRTLFVCLFVCFSL